MHPFRYLRKMPLLALAGAIVLVAFILCFDWDWFRPAVERYVSDRSHRVVRADHMELEFSHGLRPTLRFRNLYIQNAPWSSQRPLIAGKEVSFAFSSFRWPYSDTPGVVEISMVDGEANLEHMQDGLRNWRLLKPEYRGPGRYLVMALRADRSIVRFNDHSTGLDLVARSLPIPSSATSPPNQIIFKGSFRGQEFSGEAATAPRLTFQKTGETFPINGFAHAGKMELHLNGKVGDIFKNQIVDAEVHFSTSSASALNLLLNKHLPDTHALNVAAHLLKTSDEYQAKGLQGKLGNSDFAGNLTYLYRRNGDNKRSSLKGSLASNEVLSDDLFFANREPPKPAQQQTIPDLLLSQDLDLAFNAHRLLSPLLPPVTNLSMRATLNDGELKMSLAHATVFDSAVKATLALNAKTRPMSAHILIDAPDIAVDQLLSRTKLHGMIEAPLTARIDLSGVGDTPPAILSSAAGTMDFTVSHGEISDKLDAKMGLDLGKLMWLSIRGDKKIAVDHGRVRLVFKNGIGQAYDARIETSQTAVQGSGSIDLRTATLDFLLTPEPKDPTLLSFRSDIRIQGPLNKPRYHLEHRPRGASPRS